MVIAIIAVLMSILMPALGRIRKQAKGVMCQSYLKQWGMIFSLYTNDNDRKFPERGLPSGKGRWFNSLEYLYQDAEDLRLCPLVKKSTNPDGVAGLDWWGSTNLAWQIPASAATPGRQIGFYGSYGINGYVYVPHNEQPVYGKPPNRFWRTPDVKGAPDIPLFLDCYFWCGWPDADDNPPPEEDAQQRSDADAMNRFFLNRHQGRINAIFLDQSARYVGLKELFTLNWHKGFNRQGAWTTAGGVQPEDWPEWCHGLKDF